MKKLLFVLVIAPIFLCGCSATMETKLSKNSINAPMNEINGGVVSYLNAGATWIREKRRQDAYNKMHEYCGGPYKIIQEGERNSLGEAVAMGDAVIYGQAHRIKINFECDHKG